MTQKSNPTKILFILPTLTAGGAERVLITLMNGIDREKYAPEFLCVSNKGELGYLMDPSIPRHCLNQKIFSLSLPALFLKIKKVNPDIIVSNMTHMNFAVLALKPFFPQTRLIIREAITPSFLFEKYGALSPVIKALYQTLYPMADTILSPSQKIFDEFEDVIPSQKSKFILLRNPVDIEKIRNEAKLPQPNKKQTKAINFVACGRLGKQKGFDRLIESLQNFNPFHDWTLTILGEGDERQALESLIKEKGLEGKISLPGLILKPYGHFTAADCFLLPSRFEGLPNVVLEALACGTPVIATQESGGIKEIAKEAPNGAIQIVKNMSTFIKKMEEIKPHLETTPAKSLLPDTYNKQNVLQSFDKILDRY